MMKKLSLILSGISLAVFAGLLFNSCTTDTTATGSIATNVQVTSATANSIAVSWTRDPNDASPDTVIVTTSAFTPAGNSPVVVASGSTGTVTGLTVDQAYTIIIGSSAGRSSSITYMILTPPSGLMVNAASATSIGAEWTRDPNDVGYDTIVATTLAGTIAGTPAATTGSNGTVTGLSEGVQYNISIHIGTGASSSITWMTAERTTGIKIYEKADPSSSDPSGLVLASTADGGVTAIPLSGASNADFVLDDVASLPSGISLESGAVLNAQWNDMKVNPNANYVPGGLNKYYRNTDYTADIAAATVNSFDIPDDAGYGSKGSRVLICQTADGNLALVEVVPDATTGQLYSTTTDGFKYVTLNISYQSQVDEFYARRGRPRTGTGTVPRMSAH